ncbi:Receptor-like protein EIX1 [Glycine soja]|uniref:Receptor-like protein EIX1 n=1 Tax=Glycine soja TaxID=3848 RepID=A0A445GJT1_GLYSO|nr:Receptor-like protein EIX1 [Glycine soja]
MLVCFLHTQASILGFNSSSHVKCIERERQALLNFKQGLRDDFCMLSTWSNDNRIAGMLPILSNFTSLRRLDISNNQLTGEIPKSIGLLHELEYLSLEENYLEGDITESHLTIFSKLKVLGITDHSLSVKFGATWVPPFQLHTLGVASCKLGPSFPSWLQTQSHLSMLDISDAGTDDFVPDWFWNKSPHIYGRIPNFLSQAWTLDLSENKISDINSFLCGKNATTYLYTLDLSNNQIMGQLTDCWDDLNSLEYLDLSNNKLSGKIPQSMGNPGLCGQQINKICPGDETIAKPQGPAVDDNSVFHGALYMRLGIGFFTGFWGLLGPILLWQP